MNPRLLLYYDGHCPFCASEMARLQRWDKAGALGFVDIAASDFDPAPLGVELAALDRELHGLTADGRLLVGVDSIVAAYTLVGRGWLVLPLRVRMLRRPWTALYRAFARNRYRFFPRLFRRAPVQDCAGASCHADRLLRP